MRKRLRKLVCAIILLTGIMFSQIMPVMADTSDAWRTVRVSCGINNALYLDENGEPTGYCSEYLNQLAKINHWNLEYVEGSWNESVQNLYDGKIELLFPTQMTDERKEKMGFSTSIGGYQPIGLFARSDSELFYDDFKGFGKKKIAVSAGTSNEAALREYAQVNGFSYVPVYLDTAEEKMQALEDGTVDMIVFSTLNDVTDGKVVAMLDYLPFYYCANISDSKTLNELNYGMKQLLIRNPELVQNVFYDFMNRDISFAFTREENAAVEEVKKITVGVYRDTAPLFDVDADGNYHGIYADILKKIEEKSGLQIEIVALDRKEYVFDYLDQRKIDYVMGSSDQALLYAGDDGAGYVQSDAILDYTTVAITLPEYQFTGRKDMVFALTSGRRYWTSYLSQMYPQATIKYYETPKDCLEAVQSGKADVTLLNSWEYNYQSKNQRFQQMMEWENFRLMSHTVMVSREDEDAKIQSVIDKSIDQLTTEDKESIIAYNLNMPYSSYDTQDKIYNMREYLIAFAGIFVIAVIAFLIYAIMRKRTMAQLEEKNKQLEQANESKNLFLSRMSHELRTPLNAIMGYTAVLQQSVSGSEKQSLASIQRAAKYQLAIIGDLLDIQKIESGKLELACEEVDSIEYMENILQMIKPEADAKNIQFTYERLSEVNEAYWLDGVRFEQVLLNVLHNAVKFTPAGGSVKMTAEVIDHNETSNTLKFVISDTGIGMSEEFMKNYLFRKFAQEYGGNTSPYEGCGTGLAISREIMHLMGGEITCESKQGIGSTFTVILTAKHLDKKKKNRTKKQYPDYDLGGIRILLCEDNPMNQDMEKHILERMNAVVDIADDGKIGLTMFEQNGEGYYQVVLMDIRMPNMDGLETTRRIRALNRADAETVPIIAVSANAFDEDIQLSLDAGMNEHLAKPVDVPLLYEKIMQYTNALR